MTKSVRVLALLSLRWGTLSKLLNVSVPWFPPPCGDYNYTFHNRLWGLKVATM